MWWHNLCFCHSSFHHFSSKKGRERRLDTDDTHIYHELLKHNKNTSLYNSLQALKMFLFYSTILKYFPRLTLQFKYNKFLLVTCFLQLLYKVEALSSLTKRYSKKGFILMRVSINTTTWNSQFLRFMFESMCKVLFVQITKK